VNALRGWGFCAIGLALLLSSTSLAGAASAPHSVTLVERRQVNLPIDDFTLTDQAGNSFQFKTLRGKVVVVAFAYTTCADVCPLITAALRQVQSKLSVDERKASYLLTVTTDPEIDSPKVLAGYAKRYGAELDGWSFLTGSETALKSVWKNFGTGVKRKGRGLVDHTPLTAIVDRHGVLRFAFISPSPDVAVVLKDIRSLLTER
jgi:protein SCO1/2